MLAAEKKRTRRWTQNTAKTDGTTSHTGKMRVTWRGSSCTAVENYKHRREATSPTHENQILEAASCALQTRHEMSYYRMCLISGVACRRRSWGTVFEGVIELLAYMRR